MLVHAEHEGMSLYTVGKGHQTNWITYILLKSYFFFVHGLDNPLAMPQGALLSSGALIANKKFGTIQNVLLRTLH